MKVRMWALGLVMGAAPLLAQAGDAGTAYTQFGSNGLGLGFATSVSPDWAVRGQFNTMKLNYSGSVGDFGAGTTAEVKIDFNSVQLLGDWYPSGDSFRVSGGVVFNNNKITMAGNANVNNAGVVAVNAEVKMSDGLSPYIGVGFGTKPKADRGLGFNMDLGVMFQNPKASLSAPAANPADVAAQLKNMQEAVDKLKYMPVLAVGISYSF